ncbi:MAG: DUF1559 domain-containing protein [Planctomycetia bacterium]|nr:DUF1559 domain-containing protein [Planctomycetia bacterium]
MLHSRRTAAGFTLVELLVVIAIIGVLIAMLLPALQSARAAAARTSCQSKLRQVALACQLFESGNRTYPPGRVKDSGPKASWLSFLLPYIEQGQVADIYDRTVNWDKPKNKAARETVISTFICPSAPIDKRPLVTDATGTISGGVSDFVAISRLHKDAVGAGMFPSHLAINPASPDFVPGVLNVDERVSMRQITDGTTRTIIIGEMAGRPNHWLSPTRTGPLNLTGKGMWADDDSMSISLKGSNYPDPTGVTPWVDAPFGPCPMNCTNKSELFSFHGGGANVAFADGSVMLLRENINLDVLANLVTRDGKEDLDPKSYGN